MVLLDGGSGSGASVLLTAKGQFVCCLGEEGKKKTKEVEEFGCPHVGQPGFMGRLHLVMIP